MKGVDSGLDIYGNKIEIEWEIVKNKYSNGIEDISSLEYNKTDRAFSFRGYSQDHPSNNVRAIIKSYYSDSDRLEYTVNAVIPVITATSNPNYRVETEIKNTEVKYNSNGILPNYKDISAKAKAVNRETNTEEVMEEDYIRGRIYDSYGWKNKEYFQIKNGKILPNGEYNGECTSIAIEKIITNGQYEIARVHIPLYFYLERNERLNLDNWNGNSVQINDNGGLILTPQFGAGKKEKDNSFTGMLMGTVKEGKNEKTGLVGYSKGEQSLLLDADSGSAIFGKNNGGQIIIDSNADAGVFIQVMTIGKNMGIMVCPLLIQNIIK